MPNNLISRVETITPALAEEYLKRNTNNRHVRENIVQYYAKQMREGQWRLNGETITFNELGELVNGQHRLKAVIKANMPVDFLVVKNADKESFATIDCGLTRKTSDIFFVKGIPNAVAISTIILRYFKLLNNQAIGDSGRYKDGNTATRTDFLNEYASDEDFWQEIFRESAFCYRVLKLLPQSDIGAYMAYLIKVKNHDREKVYEFFYDILRNDIPKSKMLAALRRRLTNERNNIRKVGNVYKQQLIVKIWNKYIKGEETTLMRWNEEQEGKKDFI